jgi:hypothetical protein
MAEVATKQVIRAAIGASHSFFALFRSSLIKFGTAPQRVSTRDLSGGVLVDADDMGDQ